MRLTQLPSELLTTVIDHLNFRDARCLLDALFSGKNEVIEAFMHVRANPVRYYAKLVDTPIILFRIKHKTHFILVRSRALDFFSPGSCSPNSGWDFVIDDEPDKKPEDRAATRFLALTEHLLNFRWHSSGYRVDFPQVFRFNGTVQRKDGGIHNVSLEVRSGFKAWETVMDYHISPVRCFVAADAAVHMYRSDLYRKRMFIWRIQAHVYVHNQRLQSRAQCDVCRAFVKATVVLSAEELTEMRRLYKRSIRCQTVKHRRTGLVSNVKPLLHAEDGVFPVMNEPQTLVDILRPVLGMHHGCKDFVSFCQHVEKYVDREYLFDATEFAAREAESDFEERYIGDASCEVIPFSGYASVSSPVRFARSVQGWNSCKWMENGNLSLVLVASEEGSLN